MTNEETLAEMRKQYEDATLEDHILVNGVVYLRCHICKKNPVPHFACVLWCENCIDEFLSNKDKEGISDFVVRKKKETQEAQKTQEAQEENQESPEGPSLKATILPEMSNEKIARTIIRIVGPERTRKIAAILFDRACGNN